MGDIRSGGEYRDGENGLRALPVLFYFLKGCEISIDPYSSQIQSAAYTNGLVPHKGSPIITKRFLAHFFHLTTPKLVLSKNSAPLMEAKLQECHSKALC